MELDEGKATKPTPDDTGDKVEPAAANRFDPSTLDDEVGVLVRKNKSSATLAPPPKAKPARKKAKSQPLGPPKRKTSRLNAFLEATRIRPSQSETSLSESVRARFGVAKAAAKEAIAPLSQQSSKSEVPSESSSPADLAAGKREEADNRGAPAANASAHTLQRNPDAQPSQAPSLNETKAKDTGTAKFPFARRSPRPTPAPAKPEPQLVAQTAAQTIQEPEPQPVAQTVHKPEPQPVAQPVHKPEPQPEPQPVAQTAHEPEPQTVQELRRRPAAKSPSTSPSAEPSQGKAPFEPGDSSPQPFTRRQTPPQKRRRQQSRYKSAPQSTLGLSWWHHHFQAPAWIGRALWAGAFACAWIALSRCLDPSVSDPKLSQVPYYALLGWLLCAGLALNQRIPRRFRWTGLVLGAANSVALALSWSFRLDQL